MQISSQNKIIAKSALHAFGGKPLVTTYWDNYKESSIDILSCDDIQYSDTTYFSTIGASEFSIGYTSDEIPLRVELVGACYSKFDEFSNILATCAFNIINSKYTCFPGEVYTDVIQMYLSNTSMKHVMFTSPFLWEDRLETINFSNKKVAWLLAIPISDEEFKYAKKYGIECLEELLEENDIDIFNLNRKSVI